MKITRVLSGSLATLALAVTASVAAPAPAGAQSFSRTALDQAKSKLDATLTTPGTAFAVNPSTGRVEVQVDSTVTGAKLDSVKQKVSDLDGAATIKSVGGKFTTKLSGGDAIYAGGYVCSLGFNVRSGSTYYFLTAGHCTEIGPTWYSNSGQTSVIGTTAGSSFPGNDYGIVQYSTGGTPPGNVDLYNGTTQDITSAGTPSVGDPVTRSGRTTQVHSGEVTALGATVNYAEGSVSGLIQTTVCAEGGDSGGALFSGTTALGLTSGGNGDCTFGGTTYFQPVTEVLSAYGVSVY